MAAQTAQAVGASRVYSVDMQDVKIIVLRHLRLVSVPDIDENCNAAS
jgi:hypothetical protein